jgi:hypothetical protein
MNWPTVILVAATLGAVACIVDSLFTQMRIRRGGRETATPGALGRRVVFVAQLHVMFLIIYEVTWNWSILVAGPEGPYTGFPGSWLTLSSLPFLAMYVTTLGQLLTRVLPDDASPAGGPTNR